MAVWIQSEFSSQNQIQIVPDCHLFFHALPFFLAKVLLISTLFISLALVCGSTIVGIILGLLYFLLGINTIPNQTERMTHQGMGIALGAVITGAFMGFLAGLFFSAIHIAKKYDKAKRAT